MTTAERNESTAARTIRVFVSYSRRDSAWVERLVQLLEQSDVECIMDKRNLPYGEKWQLELESMIQRADAIIYVVSADSVRSRWCRWELSRVTYYSKRMIPLQIASIGADQEMPPEIADIQIIPATGTDPSTSVIDALIVALNRDRGWLVAHTQLLEQAIAWAFDSSKDRLLRGSALQQAEWWLTMRPKGAPPASQQQLDYIVASQLAAKRRGRLALETLALAVTIVGALGLWANDRRIEANQQKKIAEDQRKTAEQRLAETLLGRADALTAARRWLEARALYTQAREQFNRLGVPSPAWFGLFNLFQQAPHH